MIKSLFSKSLTIVLLGFLVSGLSADDGDVVLLKPGDRFPSFEAKDQHEQDYPMAEDTEYVFVTFDMGTGKRANKFFEEQGADWLPENNAVFLSNIYGMPGIGRAFALPKMRKYPLRIMLADEKGLLYNYPTEKSMVTVFKLGVGKKIAEIAFWDPRKGAPPLVSEK